MRTAPNVGTPAPVDPTVTARLAAMMFLQFFVWGGWYVTLGPYMAAMKMDAGIGDAYSVGPIAAILSPFFLGMIADRFFATQKVLGVMHLLGGLALLAAPTVAASTNVNTDGTREHLAFVGLLLVHMLCYMPTLGLSNTLAFHHVTNAEKQFPLIRVLGTIGWIVAGLAVGFVTKRSVGDAGNVAASPLFFYIAGGAGVVFGLCSFMLPHTPPPSAGKPSSLGDILGVQALSLLREPSFLIFILGSFLICIPLSFYYAYAGVYAGATGFRDVASTMTLGQMSEIVFMLVMPLCFARLGVKWMLAIGMYAWVARYALFAGAWAGSAIDAPHIKWMVLGGIVLHGICYDFFFVTGQIYVDKKAPPTIRGQAQGFLVLVTQGVGMLIGAQAAGKIVAHYTTKGVGGAPDALNWKMIWAMPTGMALFVLFVFVVLFRDNARKG